ncbi:Ribosome maturation factor rimM [Desulfamplus magnetovallimortis]|uniref:Ribosome maturation factor RimM n=1 Tax=Desulfamplus magnetovallimortis TaxID=1246637 RepID=A0A1W1H6D0_9BACT|nr:ribosome maturation factor RimM [Desulfamplus magnetovallimortis]SLM27945.1 Ribosome maturation factor rimM [Desulfamplus magnetovallimortis]
MGENSLFTIGKITGVHGVKGYLKIRSFSDSPESFKPGNSILLARSGIKAVSGTSVRQDAFKKDKGAISISSAYSARDDSKAGKWYEIERVAPNKKGLLLLLKGVDRNIAESLVGDELLIPRDALPSLEDDTYYWQDLIGISVVDIQAGYIGTIDHVIQTGSNDVFVVADHNRETLVPAIKNVVKQVDLERGEMRVELPDGLME